MQNIFTPPILNCTCQRRTVKNLKRRPENDPIAENKASVIYAGNAACRPVVRRKLSQWSRLDTGLPPFPQPVSLPADIHHMGVVEQLVQQCSGQNVVAEQSPPITDILDAVFGPRSNSRPPLRSLKATALQAFIQQQKAVSLPVQRLNPLPHRPESSHRLPPCGYNMPGKLGMLHDWHLCKGHLLGFFQCLKHLPLPREIGGYRYPIFLIPLTYRQPTVLAGLHSLAPFHQPLLLI